MRSSAVLTRLTAALCLLVGGGGAFAVAAHDGGSEVAVDVADDEGASRRPTTTTTTTSTSTTTPSSTTTSTTAAAAPPVPTTPPPAPAPAAEDPAVPPPPPPGPPVADVAEPGVYVLQASTGSVRRIAEPVPWDVAGHQVLVGRGLGVHALGVDGSDLGLRYTLPPSPVIAAFSGGCCDLTRERITRIEAAPDGSAVVTALVPMHTGNGSMGATRIVSPTGQVHVEDHLGLDFEWSDDGRWLANFTNGTLHLLDPQGRFVRTLGSEFVHSFRWSPDGQTIVARAAPGPVLVDAAGGGMTAVSSLSSVSDALGGGWFVGDGPWDHEAELAPLVLWHQPTGEVVTIADRNGPAVASDDGGRMAVLRSPYPAGFRGFQPANFSLEVLDRSGAVLGTVGVPEGLTVVGGNGPGLDTWMGPAWTADGDHVVFTVAPSDQPRMSP